MKIRHRRRNNIQELNTSSLPDLIFTILFFFMIVTQMRSVPVKVEYEKPKGTEIRKLVNKSSIVYIYIGKAVGSKSGETVIQVNDKIVDANSLVACIISERSKMTPEERKEMKVSIQADKDTDMGVIMDVKKALRKAKAYNISYSATKKR